MAQRLALVVFREVISRNSGIQHSKLGYFHRGCITLPVFQFHRFVAIQLWETHVEIVSAEMLFGVLLSSL